MASRSSMDVPIVGNSLSTLAPDRYLAACPINYEFPHLFVYLVEMEYVPEVDSIQTILKYPEVRDERFFKDQSHMDDFEANIKKFAYPFLNTIQTDKKANPKKYASNASSSLVQFFTFVFTDQNRIRQYGFCRSDQGGTHIICLVSYFPWYNILMTLLQKVSVIINEKNTSSLYHFLEAVYEYEVPKPGEFAEIFSHDGLDSYSFRCPDRRVVPSISENRNLLQFFAFFELEKIIKIFTALLLERRILIVSKDLDKLTSCALSMEYLIHPLEWFHSFAPIMPESVDILLFHQPFPFIYGLHPCIYEKLFSVLTQEQLDEFVILNVDERQVINGDNDQLPKNVALRLQQRLGFFKENSSSKPSTNNNQLLGSGTVQAFRDSVLMIIDNYRAYLKYDESKGEYELDESEFFKMKGVYKENDGGKRYNNTENEFYHEFRVTQAFHDFCEDRASYLKREDEFNRNNNSFDPSNPIQPRQFQKDFIEILFEPYQEEKEENKFSKLINAGIKSSKKKFTDIKNKTEENVSSMKKILNSATNTPNTALSLANPINKLQSSVRKQSSNIKADLFNSKNSQRLEGHRSSSSSESGASEISNDEKLKETIRQFTKTSDSVYSTLDKELDNLSKEVDTRVSMDLTNDPDIKKYIEIDSREDMVHNEISARLVKEDPELKLIDIDFDPDETKPEILTVQNTPPLETSQKNKNLDPFDMEHFDAMSSKEDPFNMDQFNLPSKSQPNNSKAESVSTPSWIEEQINNSISLMETAQPSLPSKKENTYQSIIDEFDPINSSVMSKVSHFNQKVADHKKNSSNLINLTPIPFENKPKPNTNMIPKMPVQSPFNPMLKNEGINKSESGSQNSIQSLLNPTPFYGGYNSTQRNFQPVQYPRPAVPMNRPNMPMSQSNNDMTSKETQNETNVVVNKSMSFTDSVIGSFDSK